MELTKPTALSSSSISFNSLVVTIPLRIKIKRNIPSTEGSVPFGP